MDNTKIIESYWKQCEEFDAVTIDRWSKFVPEKLQDKWQNHILDINRTFDKLSAGGMENLKNKDEQAFFLSELVIAINVVKISLILSLLKNLTNFEVDTLMENIKNFGFADNEEDLLAKLKELSTVKGRLTEIEIAFKEQKNAVISKISDDDSEFKDLVFETMDDLSPIEHLKRKIDQCSSTLLSINYDATNQQKKSKEQMLN